MSVGRAHPINGPLRGAPSLAGEASSPAGERGGRDPAYRGAVTAAARPGSSDPSSGRLTPASPPASPQDARRGPAPESDPGYRAALRPPGLDVGGLLYGTIVAAATLALGAGQGDSVAKMIDVMSATLIIYWLAHVYIETVSGRVPGTTVPLRRQVLAAGWRESSIMLGGLPALATVLSLAAADISLWVDVLCALCVSVGMLVIGGFLVGRRASIRGWRLAGESLGAAAFGGLLALLLVWLHTH